MDTQNNLTPTKEEGVTLTTSETSLRFNNLIQAIHAHDISFEESDDYRYWSAGNKSLNKIKELSKGLNPQDIMNIWNDNVKLHYINDFFFISLETAKSWSLGEIQ